MLYIIYSYYKILDRNGRVRKCLWHQVAKDEDKDKDHIIFILLYQN